MKKVFIIVLSCLFIILIISYIKINITKTDNKDITNKINILKKDNEKIDKDILDNETKINTLKDKNKNKWEELETWKKTKVKLEKALSQ